MPELAPLDARDPRALGGYEIVRRLGVGAQGAVYLARSPRGEQVAIKVLHGEWARDPQLRARFAAEAEAARRVDAFCTARILDARTDGEAPYIVSEYVPGPSLRDAVTGEGPYHRDRLYRLAVATATALAAIHQAGIVHRDFKPDNVLLGPDGPRVIDFGVAKAHADTGAATGYVTVGTPSYMAPEQATGDPVGPAADLFAWAEVIVFAATGRPPYGDDTAMAVAARLISEEPDLTGVDDSLRPIVAACLSRDPAARPTASDLLLRLLGHPAQPFTPSVLTEGARAAGGTATGGPAAAGGATGAPGGSAATPGGSGGAAATPGGSGGSAATPGSAGGPGGSGGSGNAPGVGRRRASGTGGAPRARRRILVGGVLAALVVAVLAVAGGLAWWRGDAPGGPPERGDVAVAGAWRGTISGPGTSLRLVTVQVAADGRTARITSPSSACAVPLRRTSAGAYAPAAARACPWAPAPRLTTGKGGALTLAATGRTVRLSRPAGTVPHPFAGHWHGRIHPANLTVDLTLRAGGRPGTWKSRGYSCTGALSVWQTGARRLVLVNARRGGCRGRPDALVLTRTAGRLAYRQVTGAGATAQRGTLRRDR